MLAYANDVAQDLPNRGEEKERDRGGGGEKEKEGGRVDKDRTGPMVREEGGGRDRQTDRGREGAYVCEWHFRYIFPCHQYADTDLKCLIDVQAWRRISPTEERKERERGGGGGEKENEGRRVDKDRTGPMLREEGEREER